MLEISKSDLALLEKKGVIKNTNKGYISLIAKDADGRPAVVGFYKTVKGRHRYIEDYYAVRANMIKRGAANRGK